MINITLKQAAFQEEGASIANDPGWLIWKPPREIN